jgi:trimethylamine--corrinoid protein Co-methyltransferase
MRPVVRFLSDELLERIVAEARDILAKLGVTIHNEGVLRMLAEHGVRVDAETNRAFLTDEIIDRALGTAPGSFKLYDVFGRQTHDLSGHNVYFTPGSAAIHILDHGANELRTPTTTDYVRCACERAAHADYNRLRPLREAGQPARAPGVAKHGVNPERCASEHLG